MRALCRPDDIPDGTARGFGASQGGFTGLFAVRRGEQVFVYLNACPHLGVSLNWPPDRFFSTDGTRLVCATHGAEFVPESGLCVSGPCLGEKLEPVMFTLDGGMICVPDDAGL